MHSYMYEFIYVFITWTNSISAGFNVNLDLIYGMWINEMKYDCLAELFLEWEIFHTKVVQKIITHILC
jgi:hypothetical protein